MHIKQHSRRIRVFARRSPQRTRRRTEIADTRISERTTDRLRTEMSRRMRQYMPILKKTRMSDVARRRYLKKLRQGTRGLFQRMC